MDNQGLEHDDTDSQRESNAQQDSTVDLYADTGKPGSEQDIHMISIDEVYKRFHTDPENGLSSKTISDARDEYGENKLTPAKKPSYLWLLFKELFMGFNCILWLAGILAFLAYKPFGEPEPSVTNLALGIVLFLVITCNSVLNVYQQLKSIKIVSSFSNVSLPMATVRRDGEERQIDAEEVLPGDIILVKMGEKVPADCRFLSCDSLKINTSELTGESKPVSITTEYSSETFMESTNIGFYSTVVEQGNGQAVVIAIGDDTVLGQMSKLTRGNAADEITGLHREVNRFVLFVVLATLTAIVILWITWAAWLNRSHRNFITYNENIVNSIGMIVGFLPMGLPSAVTLVLTIVAKQMHRQRVLLKSLQIVETFNSVSVIATDKTGTLTQNKMRVTQLLWDKEGTHQIEEESNSETNEVVQDLLLGAALCNNAEKQSVQNGDESEYEIVGDAADVALYNLCLENVEEIREKNSRLHVLPFNSSNKYMITANQVESSVWVVMKGGPDIVIQHCSTYKMDDNQVGTLDDEMKEILINRQEKLGENGCRVIAMCEQKLTQEEYEESRQSTENVEGFPIENYCFLGLFSLLDPPRDEVPQAVLTARQAQIRIAMVTGDHPSTATAIAKQVNILSSEILEENGIDTIKLENNSIVNLYRNEKLLEQHELEQSKDTNSNSDTSNEPSSSSSSCCVSCRNQFKDPVDTVDATKKLEYIPYAVAITGSDLHYLDEYLWDWILSHQEFVFARTSPEQKLQIVKQFQKRGEIVAVTGDGTNDAPALKCANLGVAMESGTEVSKEAGDMILLDNDFASIIKAIETGRLLSDNLKKVAVYLLPGGSWSQIWPVFFNLWFGMPLALTAFLATVFCMINDVFMSLAMVTEKPERDIMLRPPLIRSKDHLLNWKLLLHAYLFVGNFECFTGFFCFCYYWIDSGVPFYSFMFTYEKFGDDPQISVSKEDLLKMTYVAQSVYYCSVCLFQFFNYFATRTRYASILEHNPFWGKGKNWTVSLAMIISAGIQLIITKVYWFNQVFKTGPVPVKYVMPALGFGMCWLIIDEIRKWRIRKSPDGILSKIAW